MSIIFFCVQKKLSKLINCFAFPYLFRHWINKDDCDKSAKEYRSHFKGLEHQNYYGLDSNETPIVVSVKLDTNTGCYDLIVRTNDGNQIACVRESPTSGEYDF